ncbi:MAG: site-2 protease family protein [Dehalococcoidia bacterium]|nr:site-2 protease family protein [Dehalococcoidia bacterium]
MLGSIKIARVFGISIRLHYTWFIVFGLVVWSLSTGYFPMEQPTWSSGMNWLLGGITTLLLFVSVVLHELAHSVVARAKGTPVDSITLFIFGGVSNLSSEPDSAAKEFQMAIVGPASSVVLAVLFSLVSWISQPSHLAIAAVANYLAYINAALAVFNMIPGFPLDGGRVLRSAVWWIKGDFAFANRIAAGVGRFVAYTMIFGGLFLVFGGNWVNGLWLLFIGWFLNNAAEATQRGVVLHDALRDVPLDRVITREFEVVSPDLTLESLVHDYVLKHHWRAYPVVADGRLVGLISLTDLKRIPRDKWTTTPIRDVMTKLDELKTVSVRDDAAAAFRLLTDSNVNQLPVVESGNVIGLVNRENILKLIQMRGQLGYRGR